MAQDPPVKIVVPDPVLSPVIPEARDQVSNSLVVDPQLLTEIPSAPDHPASSITAGGPPEMLSEIPSVQNDAPRTVMNKDISLSYDVQLTAKDNAVQITDINKGVPFRGGCFTDREISMIPLGGYSMIQNIRGRHPGFEKRLGCRRLHTVADGTNRVETLFQFSKGKQTERHFFAQMSDGDVLDATTAPPGITTGAFGTEVYSATGTIIPASWAILRDWLLFADSTDVARIYSGNNEYVGAFIVYKGTETIPSIPSKGADYSIEVSTDDTTLYAVLDSLSVLTDYDCIFIKTYTPADTLTWAFKAVNATASTLQMHYWNGAWTAVTGFTDNTASAGACMAQDGTMTWTMTTDHVPHYMFGQSGYWHRLSLASGSLDSEVEVYTVKYNSDWCKMQNMWDGVPLPAIESYIYFNSSATYEFYESTGIDIGGMTSSDKYYFNSKKPSIAMYVSVGAVPNTTASTTATIKYWNGTAFSSVSSQSDATSENSKSHAKDGWITWAHPTDEQPSMFQSSQYFSYWYEVSFDKTLTSDMSISVETMPYFTMTEFGKCIGVAPFKRRAAYAFDKLPGYIAISSAQHPFVLNGTDYTVWEIGDGRDNKVVAMKSFYNELMVFQEEKGVNGGCITLIQGYSPETYGTLLIDTHKGTLNSKSVVVVSGVLTWYKFQNTPATVAFFISHYGVFMCDGQNVISISHQDTSSIQNYFDPTQTECIRSGYEDKAWITYDSVYNCLRIGIVSGQSATECNVFPVYDIEDRAWSFDSPSQPFSCACEVEAASGYVTVIQVSGGNADGFVYQSNYGSNDVSTAIDAYATMELDAQGAEMLMREFILRKTGSCTLTPYLDTVAQTPISIT